MFGNTGGKIKMLAKPACAVGITGRAVGAIILYDKDAGPGGGVGADSWRLLLYSFLLLCIGVLLSRLSCRGFTLSEN